MTVASSAGQGAPLRPPSFPPKRRPRVPEQISFVTAEVVECVVFAVLPKNAAGYFYFFLYTKIKVAAIKLLKIINSCGGNTVAPHPEVNFFFFLPFFFRYFRCREFVLFFVTKIKPI